LRPQSYITPAGNTNVMWTTSSTKTLLVVVGVIILFATAAFSFNEYRNAKNYLDEFHSENIEESLSSVTPILIVILVKIMFLALAAYVGGILIKYGLQS